MSVLIRLKYGSVDDADIRAWLHEKESRKAIVLVLTNTFTAATHTTNKHTCGFVGGVCHMTQTEELHHPARGLHWSSIVQLLCCTCEYVCVGHACVGVMLIPVCVMLLWQSKDLSYQHTAD